MRSPIFYNKNFPWLGMSRGGSLRPVNELMPSVKGILRGLPTLRRHKETLVRELTSCEVSFLYRKLGRQLLIHKTEWNNAICSNRDGLKYYYAKWSKPNKRKINITWCCLYVKSKKTNKLIFKTDRDSDKENKFMVTKAERAGDKLGVWD